MGNSFLLVVPTFGPLNKNRPLFSAFSDLEHFLRFHLVFSLGTSITLLEKHVVLVVALEFSDVHLQLIQVRSQATASPCTGRKGTSQPIPSPSVPFPAAIHLPQSGLSKRESEPAWVRSWRETKIIRRTLKPWRRELVCRDG